MSVNQINTGISFVLWTSFYVVVAHYPLLLKPKECKLSLKDDLDVRNRMVSIIHGLVLLFVGGQQYLYEPGYCGSPSNEMQLFLMHFSTGYFLYDTLALFYYRLVDPAMLVHHLMCIIGMTLTMIYNMSANYIIMAMFIGEASNPFMHIRSIIKAYGLRYTKIYESIEALFILFYCGCRLGLGVNAVYMTIACEKNHIVLRICAGILMT